MLIRCVNILSLTLLLSQFTFAQKTNIEDLKFENYSPRNGLPSDFIQTITQDKYGFIWLGTHNGLFRFDGVQFKTYQHNGSDSNSLPDNDARNILGDSTGKIWIASRKGLFFYNYAQDNFIRINTHVNGQPINFSSCLVMDSQNQLWFYSNIGICRMDCKTLVITVVRPAGTDDFPYSEHRLFSTKARNIWFNWNYELYCFDPRLNIFKKQEIVNDDGLLFSQGIQDIFEESKDKIWIASLFGLYMLNTKEHLINKYPYQYKNKTDSNVYIAGFNICPPLAGDSILWCSTSYRGLLLFNLHTKKFIKSFLQDNYEPGSIGGSFCYAGFTDRDGILWVSHVNGLSKLDWHDQQIKSYRIREMADSNVIVPIRKMVQDKNTPSNYWLITWGDGVLYYNKSSNKIIGHYETAITKGYNIIQLSYDGVYDENGKLWIGSNVGLCYYDTKKNKFVNANPDFFVPEKDKPVVRMIRTDHTLWLGTEAGLLKFDIAQNKFKKYQASNDADSNIVKSSVFAMHFDHTGKLYVGTQTGLFMLDTSSGQIHSMIRSVGNNKTDFNINYIWGLDVDNENNLWVTTRGDGFYKFNPTNQTYTDYKFGNGLTTEELRDIFIDSLQDIWLSSYEGIFKMDHQSKNFIRFTPQDGLNNFNISLGRWSIINDKIYSGSPGAYSIIDPYARKSLTNHFPVWITGIKVVDRPVHFNPDSSVNMTVPVSYNENVINFEFAAICNTAASKIKYAYMLEDFDKDWHFNGDQRSANYNNLAGGTYSFKVKAMNAEGLWSDMIASVNIKIKPAFWQTLWFRLLMGVIIAWIIGLLFRRRIKNIQREAVYNQQRAVFRQKLAETEMVALRAQMNPHFIFNCMNIIDGLITDNRKEEAQDFLQKFSKLIRLVLENSQHQLVPLHQDIEAVKLYIELEAVRYSHSFAYEIDVDPALVESNYRIPPLLLQPYIENAIVHGLRHKHSGKGKLFIAIKKKEGMVFISIEDNGIGRTKSKALNLENKKPHQPIGMNVTGKRIDLLKMMNQYAVDIQIIDLDSGEETGTRVIIRLPLDFRFE